VKQLSRDAAMYLKHALDVAVSLHAPTFSDALRLVHHVHVTHHSNGVWLQLLRAAAAIQNCR
jgi:hypothetical protein